MTFHNIKIPVFTLSNVLGNLAQILLGMTGWCFVDNWSERRNKVFFPFSLFLSASLTFLPAGVIVGFRNFVWGFMSQKIIFRVGGKACEHPIVRTPIGTSGNCQQFSLMLVRSCVTRGQYGDKDAMSLSQN